VASLSQGRTAAAQCGLFTHKSVPVIFEPPCISWRNQQCDLRADVRFQSLLCSNNITATLRNRLVRYLTLMEVTTPLSVPHLLWGQIVQMLGYTLAPLMYTAMTVLHCDTGACLSETFFCVRFNKTL